MRIVLDTNVLVSGLLNPFGAPGRILDLILAGEIVLAFDDRLMAEYEDVLLRPRFAFEPSAVHVLLDYLRETGLPVSAAPIGRLGEQAADPDDLPFIEVALSAEVEVLVTGNSRDFGFLAVAELLVQSPAEFLAKWGGGGSTAAAAV